MQERHAAGLHGIPWHHAWYEPWRDIGGQVERRIAEGLTSWQALNETRLAPVRFVPSADLPSDVPYEQFVANSGDCPTRAGAHDFFNGLCWLKFPATKRRINQLQARQIARDGIHPERGAVRDSLTLLDENAAFLHAPRELWDALANKQWQTLFGPMRALWREARLLVFGHALLEKLCTPRKALTAHVYRVDAACTSLSKLDAWVAQDLRDEKLAAKPFAHLPILGVPQWWPANDNPAFYDDAAVFRRPKREVPDNRKSRVHTGPDP